MLSIRTELEEYPDREEVIIHASALPLRLYIDQVRMYVLQSYALYSLFYCLGCSGISCKLYGRFIHH